jgi:hypothetical protein
MKRMICLILLIASFLCSLSTNSFSADATYAFEQENLNPDKSPSTAVWLSAGFTFIPAIIGAALIPVNKYMPFYFSMPSLVFGPSIGYFYGRMNGRGLLFIGIHAVIAGGTLFWAALEDLKKMDENFNEKIDYVPTLATGTGLLAAAALIEIILLPFEVDKRNQELANKRIRIAPLYAFQGNSSTVGIQLGINF